jgi:hypothetical protein
MGPRTFSLAESLRPVVAGRIPDLTRIGVRSLKIEGRMRSADYVGQVVAVNREALDRLKDNKPWTKKKGNRPECVCCWLLTGRSLQRPAGQRPDGTRVPGRILQRQLRTAPGTVLKADPVTAY